MRRVILSAVVLVAVCLLAADSASARCKRKVRCCYEPCYVSACCGCSSCVCGCQQPSCCGCQPKACGCHSGQPGDGHHHGKPPVKAPVKVPETPKAPPPAPVK
jgi:hypothetical protein